jgi:hypothetical protein
MVARAAPLAARLGLMVPLRTLARTRASASARGSAYFTRTLTVVGEVDGR